MRKAKQILSAALVALALPLAAAEAALPWYADRLEALGFQVLASPEPAPEILVESLQGGSARLSELRGKAVLLNFWATWCPPCRAELPSLQALWKATKDKPFALMAVSVGESRQTVQGFADRNRYDLPFYLDPRSQAGALYGARSIPTTYVLDKEGRVIALAVGSREYGSPEALAFFAELASR